MCTERRSYKKNEETKELSFELMMTYIFSINVPSLLKALASLYVKQSKNHSNTHEIFKW